MHTIKKLAKNELVHGLQIYNFENDNLYDACAKGNTST